MHFDIQKLIDDLGGAPYVAKSLGICRTTPYGWVRRDFVSSTYLSKIKQVWPTLDLDQYFTEEMNEHIGRSTRVSGSRMATDTNRTGY